MVNRCGSKNNHIKRKDWTMCSKFANYSRCKSQHKLKEATYVKILGEREYSL